MRDRCKERDAEDDCLHAAARAHTRTHARTYAHIYHTRIHTEMMAACGREAVPNGILGVCPSVKRGLVYGKRDPLMMMLPAATTHKRPRTPTHTHKTCTHKTCMVPQRDLLATKETYQLLKKPISLTTFNPKLNPTPYSHVCRHLN